MSHAYKFRDQDRPYFVTFTTIRWLDVFTRRCYSDIVVDSLAHCIKEKGLILFAWVIMTNHVHLAMGTEGDPMQAILRDLKKFTSKKIYKTIVEHPAESRKEWLVWAMEREGKYNVNNWNIQFWQQGNHPIELHSPALMKQKIEYIHHNPVKAGFVSCPEHYLYSSAYDYAGGTGLLPIVHAI